LASARSRTEERRSTFFGEFVAGWRFSVGNRILATLLVAVAIIKLGSSTLSALDLFFVLGPYRVRCGHK
jgi:hypothetical protein